MNIEPHTVKQVVFDDSFEDPFDCCDSVVAALSGEQLQTWLDIFEEKIQNEEAAEYCDFGTRTAVFDIDGQTFVAVSDSGGEWMTAEFQEFCETNNIPSQFVIDSLDCSDVDVDDIYTGCMEEDENKDLLRLLHKIYN